MAAPFLTILALTCGAVVRGEDESFLLQGQPDIEDFDGAKWLRENARALRSGEDVKRAKQAEKDQVWQSLDAKQRAKVAKEVARMEQEVKQDPDRLEAALDALPATMGGRAPFEELAEQDADRASQYAEAEEDAEAEAWNGLTEGQRAQVAEEVKRMQREVKEDQATLSGHLPRALRRGEEIPKEIGLDFDRMLLKTLQTRKDEEEPDVLGKFAKSIQKTAENIASSMKKAKEQLMPKPDPEDPQLILKEEREKEHKDDMALLSEVWKKGEKERQHKKNSKMTERYAHEQEKLERKLRDEALVKEATQRAKEEAAEVLKEATKRLDAEEYAEEYERALEDGLKKEEVDYEKYVDDHSKVKDHLFGSDVQRLGKRRAERQREKEAEDLAERLAAEAADAEEPRASRSSKDIEAEHELAEEMRMMEKKMGPRGIEQALELSERASKMMEKEEEIYDRKMRVQLGGRAIYTGRTKKYKNGHLLIHGTEGKVVKIDKDTENVVLRIPGHEKPAMVTAEEVEAIEPSTLRTDNLLPEVDAAKEEDVHKRNWRRAMQRWTGDEQEAFEIEEEDRHIQEDEEDRRELREERAAAENHEEEKFSRAREMYSVDSLDEK